MRYIMVEKIQKKPEFARKKLGKHKDINEVKKILRRLRLNSVCEEARCPNIGECFKNKTATFLILGNSCTRNCGFCAVSHSIPLAVNKDEPKCLEEAVIKLKLEHIVITSVTRDDLPDGGAGHFADCITHLKKMANPPIIEVLTPDFKGDSNSIYSVVKAKPDIFNHNVETVKELYINVRPQADYDLSLCFLNTIKTNDSKIIVKSGIMVGLGETEKQVLSTIKDIADTGCNILTIGQYLQPSRYNLSVKEYIEPEKFEFYKKKGIQAGLDYVFSGTFVRSSYNAGQIFNALK